MIVNSHNSRDGELDSVTGEEREVWRRGEGEGQEDGIEGVMGGKGLWAWSRHHLGAGREKHLLKHHQYPLNNYVQTY